MFSLVVVSWTPLLSALQRRDNVVIRRYSEFVSLWDVLYRRYPFRLFPALPPKRIGGWFEKDIWFLLIEISM